MKLNQQQDSQSADCMQMVMTALDEEGAGKGPAKRPHVPGLIDAGLVPLQTLMHQCWHHVILEPHD